MRKRPYSAPSVDLFDAVVIGSGFGGSVVAYRLAEAGKRVCLLERGKSYPPGSFPRTPREVRDNFWRPSKRRYGMFDIWMFNRMAAIVSSGLGGGSLIYANVLLRKDPAWFGQLGSRKLGEELWPVTRRDLEPHYDAVEKILAPEIYPFEYQHHNKTSAMREAAYRLQIEETTYDKIDPRLPQWFLPPLAITFRDARNRVVQGAHIAEPLPNIHHKPRETCRLCGECDIGCNYGSKNTLDYNYLTLAQRHSAEIRDRAEAETIVPTAVDGRDGYEVTYTEHDERTYKRTQRSVVAKRVIVACGSLGSTLLLMRNKSALRALSPMLGRRFCGNGDYLAFALRCMRRESPLHGRRPQPLNASRAPVITSTFRFPDAADTSNPADRGAYLQDAGYPLAGDYIWELTDPLGELERSLHFAWRRVRAAFLPDANRAIAGDIERLLGDGALSSSTMPLLGMGRDVPNGRMHIDRKRRLQLEWHSAPSKRHYAHIDRACSDAAKALGGRYYQSPTSRLFNEAITVHPLGGCPMGRSPCEGVVDPLGEVFGHLGLYVVDGSVLPGPVGANPSLTIAANADRIATRMLETWE